MSQMVFLLPGVPIYDIHIYKEGTVHIIISSLLSIEIQRCIEAVKLLFVPRWQNIC